MSPIGHGLQDRLCVGELASHPQIVGGCEGERSPNQPTNIPILALTTWRASAMLLWAATAFERWS